jgi:hypothetical protein
MQMFYTPSSSNAQSHHKQRIIPLSTPTPPESLKIGEDDAGNSGILFVYRGFMLLEGGFVFRYISGYSRILHPNVLHMFYSFTECFTVYKSIRQCFQQE